MTDFVSFARAHGVEIDHLYESEKIKRCGTTDKPRSKNGAYFWDGRRGWVQNWTEAGTVIWYADPNAKPWSPEEKRAWVNKWKTSLAEQDKVYGVAAQKAVKMLNAAKSEKHVYLHAKGFPDAKGLVLEDRLLIPMRNATTNNVQGLQHIFYNAVERKYEKKMLNGMRAKGAVFRMGAEDALETFLVEGYATGLSLLAALRSIGLKAAVVVCFSANNLAHVAPMIKGRVMVFADNDESGVGQEVAEQTGLAWGMSDTVGFDANDLHQKHGLFAVCKIIMEIRGKLLTSA